jgi:hypothetical protein
MLENVMNALPSTEAASVPPELPPRPALSRENASHYIATMTRDLAKIARSEGYQTLAYVLEIAQLEAESLGRTHAPKR